jgi:hypothetical protein
MGYSLEQAGEIKGYGEVTYRELGKDRVTGFGLQHDTYIVLFHTVQVQPILTSSSCVGNLFEESG